MQEYTPHQVLQLGIVRIARWISCQINLLIDGSLCAAPVRFLCRLCLGIWPDSPLHYDVTSYEKTSRTQSWFVCENSRPLQIRNLVHQYNFLRFCRRISACSVLCPNTHLK